jgi:serine/threonine protein kinase
MLSPADPRGTLSAESEIVPGDVLVQKYRVDQVLGRGGMGIVFSAKHLLLGERVAIKVLTRSASEHQEALKRLQREARILARLDNEHVVRVLDLGQLENGAPFIVMEYLAGRDLGSLLEEQGRFAPQVAVGLVLQTAVALAAAHSNGVVHRDIKPENLFCVEREGSRLVKVLDFGVSRLERSRDDDVLMSSVTHSNSVVGTPLYMSPEQIRNVKEVDARSDIWSLGVVLYELMAGVPPFVGASLGDVVVKIAAEDTPPLIGVVPAVDPGLAAVVTRCLEKDRERRFRSVAELARALGPFAPAGSEQMIERIESMLKQAASEPASAIHSSAAEDGSGREPEATPPSVTPPPPAPEQRNKRRSRSFGFAAAALVAMAASFAWLFAGPSVIEPRGTGALATGALATVRVDESVSPPNPSSKAIVVTPVAPVPVQAQVETQSTRKSASSDRPLAVKPPNQPLHTTARSPSSGACNPPYTMDTEGRKKFKHECFIDRSAP